MDSRPPKKSDPAEGRRPTLKDVAKKAGGVHPSTVSLALRNHPGISAALKKRIKAAAEALGYRPDPMLDAFNNHRVEAQPRRSVSTIAWVVEGADRRSVMADPFHEALWTGAKQAAETFHCQLEFFLVGAGQLSPARLNTVLRARGITGVVLAGIRATTLTVPLDWAEFCAVRVESGHLPHPLYSIAFDHRHAFRMAWRRLTDQGFQRIGLILAPGTPPWMARQYLAGHGFERHRQRPEDHIEPFLAESLSIEPVLQWQKTHALDAVIANHPALMADLVRPAFSVLRTLAGVCLAGQLAPAWMTATVPDGTAAGAQAVEQVVMLLRNHQRGHPSSMATTYLPLQWRQGETVPPRLLCATR